MATGNAAGVVAAHIVYCILNVTRHTSTNFNPLNYRLFQSQKLQPMLQY